MKTALKAIAALAVLLALRTEAAAQTNFAPVQPRIAPQVVRPVIAPRADVHRLTRRVRPTAPETDEPEDESHMARMPAEHDLTKAARVPAPAAPPKPGRDAARAAPLAVALAPVPPARPDAGGAAEGGPQPEPPTIRADTGGARQRPERGLERARRIPGHLAEHRLGREAGRFADLRDWLERRQHTDPDGLGGGDGPGGFDWKARFGLDRHDPESVLERTRRDRIDPEALQDGYDPNARNGGFERPRMSAPRLGRPGRAGAGLRFSGGRTRQDSASSCGPDCAEDTVVHSDGSVSTARHYWFPAPDNTSDDGDRSNGVEGAGMMISEIDTVHADGSRTRTKVRGEFDENGNYTYLGSRTEAVPNEDGEVRLPPVIINVGEGPDGQPDPVDGSGGEAVLFECFDPAFPCQRRDVDWEDAASQPGFGGAGAGLRPGRPSVAERIRAVTQPLPGGGHEGGGGRRRSDKDPCINADCGPHAPE